MNVTVAEMKANLSEILRKLAQGEEVVVTKHGKPYVTLEGNRPKRNLPRVGAFDGEFKLPEDWKEIETGFEEYIS